MMARFRTWSLIALIAIIPVVLLRPFQNTPFVDDWSYAWSVENLLRTGRVEILDWSTSINLAQLAWGSLFCLPFGFSFTALRISTWVLSVIGLCAFYDLLREMQVSHRDALLGAVLLLAYPVYLMLSFTFMTDVPWLTLTILFALCLIKAVRRKQTGWLIMAAVFAFLAGTIRLTGLALPVVMVAVLFFHSGAWGRSRLRLAIPALCWIALVGIVLYSRSYVAHRAALTWIPGSPPNRIASLRDGLLYLYLWIPRGMVSAAAVLGIALIPWIVGSIRKLERKLVFAGVLLILMICLAVGAKYSPPLNSGDTWSVYELGATESLVPPVETRQTPKWIQWALSMVAYLSFAIAMTQIARRPNQPGVATLQWLIGLAFLQVCILWLFYDRYFLMLLPFIAALVLTRLGFSRPSASLALGGVFLILGMIGVRDHLAYNRALWSAVSYLHEQGVKDIDIDGGYVVNGWLQYAHPQNAKRDNHGDVQVNWVNAKDLQGPYRISNHPMNQCQAMKVIQYHRWLGRSGSIYVLRK